jgi:hypothetical protein
VATTPEGRALTEQHRIWQALLGAEAAASVLELAALIDPTNIDAGVDEWLEQMVALQQVTHVAGVDEAIKYLRNFRIAELGTEAAANMPVVDVPFDPKVATRNVAWAPQVAKTLTGRGARPVDAWAQATKAVAAKVQHETLEAGRDVVERSAEKAGSAWRRVADSNPCAFCALLASRGPVYNRSTVVAKLDGFKFHYHCGCSMEEVPGGIDDWKPSEREQLWDAAYEASHRSGMTLKETLDAMKAKAPELFSDSPKTKPE